MRIVGVNSGTSCDGLDFALVEFRSGKLPRVTNTQTYRYSTRMTNSLLQAGEPEFTDGFRWMELDEELGNVIGKKASSFIAGIKPRLKTDFIASHGHTIRHLPRKGYRTLSLQIGDPSQIAAETGIPVISDFRKSDIAAGGEGAPLSPILHQVLFGDRKKYRVIVNIGGIANITVLPSAKSNIKPLAADCGPGNMAVDLAMKILLSKNYDRGGTVALKGSSNNRIVETVIGSSFFRSRPPRSTGRESFGMTFTENIVKRMRNSRPEDIIATISEITARLIADFVSRFATGVEELYLCGGGSKNKYFVSRLSVLLPGCNIATTADLDYDPDYLEAMLWAYLGYCFVMGRRIDSRLWTGARKTYIPGSLCLP